jgi:hypothetical protein
MPYSNRERVTVIKGDGWRSYVPKMPHSQMRPIGTVKVGSKMEGALVLDLTAGLYMLIDKTGAWYELNQANVRAALTANLGF